MENKSVIAISSQEDSSINEILSQEESVKLKIIKKTTDFAGISIFVFNIKYVIA